MHLLTNQSNILTILIDHYTLMVILKSAYLGSFCLDNCKSSQLENWDADRENFNDSVLEKLSHGNFPPWGPGEMKEELWKQGNGCLQGSTCSAWICLEAIRKNPVIGSRRKRGTQTPRMYTSQKLKIARHGQLSFICLCPLTGSSFVSFSFLSFPNPLASFSFPFLSLSFNQHEWTFPQGVLFSKPWGCRFANVRLSWWLSW